MGRTLVAAIVLFAGIVACGRVGYVPIDDEVPSRPPADDGALATDGGRGDLPDAPHDAPPFEVGRADVPAPPGDAPDPGLCSSGQCKRAFVSSVTTPGGFGGLEMGDQFCQSLAAARALGGVFKAWLSDGTTNTEARFSHPTVPYRLVDGTLVADSWADLIDGNLAHAIDMHETGAPADLAGSHVWTSTTRTGRTTTADCNGWTSSSAQLQGGVGFLNSATTTWTAVTTDPCDRSDVHLYCFEQ